MDVLEKLKMRENYGVTLNNGIVYISGGITKSQIQKDFYSFNLRAWERENQKQMVSQKDLFN